MDEITTNNSGLTDAEEALLQATLEQAHEGDNRETLPLNSKSLLIDESSSRFSSAIWYENIQKKYRYNGRRRTSGGCPVRLRRAERPERLHGRLYIHGKSHRRSG